MLKQFNYYAFHFIIWVLKRNIFVIMIKPYNILNKLKKLLKKICMTMDLQLKFVIILPNFKKKYKKSKKKLEKRKFTGIL